MTPRFFGWLAGVCVGALLLIVGWAAFSPGFFHGAFLWASVVWMTLNVGGTPHIAGRNFLGLSAALSVLAGVVFGLLFGLALGWVAMFVFIVATLMVFLISAASAE